MFIKRTMHGQTDAPLIHHSRLSQIEMGNRRLDRDPSGGIPCSCSICSSGARFTRLRTKILSNLTWL